MRTSSKPQVALAGFCFMLIVIGLWGAFGWQNGFGGETGLIYTSDIQPGFDGFFYVDPLRKFTSVFYHLSYLLSFLVGRPGDFVVYQVLYGLLWAGRALLTTVIVDRLLPGRPALALIAGLIVALDASDGSLNWIGQLNQFGFVFLMLVSFLLFIVAVDGKGWVMSTTAAGASAIFGYLSLWSYESPLPVMLVFPAIVALQRSRTFSLKNIVMAGIYSIPVLIFCDVNLQRYLATEAASTYQSTVARQHASIHAILVDLWLHIRNGLFFWRWPHAIYHPERMGDYLIAFVPVAVGTLGILLQAMRAEERETPRPFLDKPVIVLACSGGVLLVCSYLVILVLSDNRNMWRTEYLPSFALGLILSAILYGLFVAVGRAKIYLALCGVYLTAMAAFATLAGVNSGEFFNVSWERHRKIIASILASAPDVQNDTLIVIEGLDRPKDPFGHSMWFDLALRLAYPGKTVAGLYEYGDQGLAPGSNISVIGGRPMTVLGGFPTLFHQTTDPIKHVLVFDYDPATEQAAPASGGPVVNALASYRFCDAVALGVPAVLATNRYGPIDAAKRIDCSKE